MTPVRRLSLVLLSSSLLLGVSACATSSGPSQEAYAARAEEVCATFDEELAELYAEHDAEVWTAAATGESNINVDRPERWVRAKVVPKYESMSGTLKGIPAPDGDVAYLSDLYADLDDRIEVLHRRPSDGRVVIDGDAQLRDRFESYGIEGCPPPLPVEGNEGEGQ